MPFRLTTVVSSNPVTPYTDTSYCIHILWEVCRSIFFSGPPCILFVMPCSKSCSGISRSHLDVQPSRKTHERKKEKGEKKKKKKKKKKIVRDIRCCIVAVLGSTWQLRDTRDTGMQAGRKFQKVHHFAP